VNEQESVLLKLIRSPFVSLTSPATSRAAEEREHGDSAAPA